MFSRLVLIPLQAGLSAAGLGLIASLLIAGEILFPPIVVFSGDMVMTAYLLAAANYFFDWKERRNRG
jgi:hypothetical protein